MLRHHVIGLGSLLLGALSFGGWNFSRQGSQPLVLSMRNDVDGQHYTVGYRLGGKCQFATRVAQRCHDTVQHPSLPLALFVARRPGTESYLIDLSDGRLLQTPVSQRDRHFYGHSVFHQSGEWLYVTEDDTAGPGRGVFGIYRFDDERLQHSDEISTYGLGSHQISWMLDGETLVVVNGGIRTGAESQVEMDLDAIESSLILMRRNSNLLPKETPAQQMNSVRHLAIGRDGTAVADQQFMGDAYEHVSLLTIKRPGCPFKAFPMAREQHLAMTQYTASVTIHDDLRLVAPTTPCGNRFFIWDLGGGVVRLGALLPDYTGIDTMKNGFVVTSGQGRCHFYDCQDGHIAAQPLELSSGLWDNHLHLA